jgi:hypothetical protein
LRDLSDAARSGATAGSSDFATLAAKDDFVVPT